MPISILMLKIIFIKYIPPVKHKVVPKLKMLTIYWNYSKCSEFIEIWHIWYFGYPDLNLKSKMIFIKYLPPVSRKFVPKLKLQRLYLNLAQLMF